MLMFGEDRKNLPCYLCVKRAEFGGGGGKGKEKEDLPPFNALEIGFASNPSSVITPPPGFELISKLSTGSGDLKQVVLFGRRISRARWEEVKHHLRAQEEEGGEEEAVAEAMGKGRGGGGFEKRRHPNL